MCLPHGIYSLAEDCILHFTKLHFWVNYFKEKIYFNILWRNSACLAFTSSAWLLTIWAAYYTALPWVCVCKCTCAFFLSVVWGHWSYRAFVWRSTSIYIHSSYSQRDKGAKQTQAHLEGAGLTTVWPNSDNRGPTTQSTHSFSALVIYNVTNHLSVHANNLMIFKMNSLCP